MTCPQGGMRLACRAVTADRRGVSRWLLVSMGRPRLEDDPTGDLMREVETVWHSLEPDFMYLPREDRLRALSALCVAALAHQGQRRKSGEPYLTHPVAESNSAIASSNACLASWQALSGELR